MIATLLAVFAHWRFASGNALAIFSGLRASVSLFEKGAGLENADVRSQFRNQAEADSFARSP